MFFGSAFKGANGINQTFIDIDRYLANHKSYVQLYHDQKQVSKFRKTSRLTPGKFMLVS